MINFFKKINNSISEKKKYIFITIMIVLVMSMVMHFFLTMNFIDSFKPLAAKVYQGYVDKDNTKNYIITNEKIFIFDTIKNKQYHLKNKSFVLTNDVIPKLGLGINVENHTTIYYPFYVSYKFENVDILVEINSPNHFIIYFLLILIITTLIINTMYSKYIDKNTSRMKTLKVSVQEYALSQRTTSYLVSIMHHKLNTPLKVLNTKARMLVEVIDKARGIDEETLAKAQNDYIQLYGAVTTITSVTQKLKSYNESSQNVSRVYELFKMSTDTINILKDDEFTIDVDYNAQNFDINRTIISSHEIIQIFINQIKFSLTQLADKIGVRIFKHDDKSITILYSDNGNKIDDEFIDLLSDNINISEMSNNKLESDQFDLMLNFSILNDSVHSSIKILSSNRNGNVFEIKLPAFLKKERVGLKNPHSQ